MFMFLYLVMNSFGTDFQIQKTIVAVAEHANYY